MKIFSIIFLLAVLISLTSCSEDCKLNDIDISNIPTAKLDSNYYYKINLSSNCDIVYRSFEKIDGSLPDGITFETTGEIFGIPEHSGTFEFTIKAKACFGSNGFEYTNCVEKTKTLTIIVKP